MGQSGGDLEEFWLLHELKLISGCNKKNGSRRLKTMGGRHCSDMAHYVITEDASLF